MRTFRFFSADVLATLLLCSCAATSVKHTWKAPEYQGGPVTHVAVLTIDERGLLRQGFENRFVAQLRKEGVTAFATFDQLSLPEINENKPAAAERFRSAGAQTLLILRLVGIGTSYREVRTGADRYAGVLSGSGTASWYDYYSVSFTDLSPTYGSLKQRVLLETSLFDLNSAKHLWSGLTETTVTESMDRVAEMNPIVAKFVEAMRKDGMIP